MPLYEHVFIARQDLSNTQAEGLIEHFSTVLADNGGKVVENEYWGVKTMAYKINKNRKGHYALLKSDAPATAVQEMERLMRLHDDVMRVLTIKVDKHEEGPTVQMQKRDERDRGERGDRPDRGFGDRGDRPSFGGDRGGDRGGFGGADRRR
ncbi:MAG: 30S ribosomal protein S6 [Cereibacter sphaeroides]|uniref:Small ribosomal subunit protein bS6 n=1 Tax=Cereibacter sphaeroides TaxID=1063 RepID=A0A2W5SG05_CERSP|nr:MAG: 30S ribosomal protein S6 [Cereibacter sphaeroides]